MTIMIMPTTYFFILLILSVGLHFTFPIFALIIWPYTYLGLAFIILGALLNVWADSIFKHMQISVKPNEMPYALCTLGPFKISRNPMYLGMTAILFGTSILLGSLITFVSPLIFIILIEILFIPMEENNMEKKFKKEYLEYKHRVRRWI